MAKTPTATSPSADVYMSDIISGAHGEQYQKDLALVIFERATRKGYDFRLGYEMAIADKFDDVAYFNKGTNVWTLIQTKHADTSKGKSPLKFDMLFPADEASRKNGDFSLFKYFKSYLMLQNNIKERKNVIIFTNRDFLVSSLDQSMEVEPRIVDEILLLGRGNYNGLKVKDHLIKEMLAYVNQDFTALRNSIAKLFNEGVMDQVIKDYKTPVAKIFIKSENCVKFATELPSEAHQMITSLSIDIQSAQVPLNKCSDIFSGNSRNKTFPLSVNEDTVHQFFQDLILFVGQPDSLRDVLNHDLYTWKRSWIRPKYLNRLEESQLGMSSVSLDNFFDRKQSLVKMTNDRRPHKKFLQLRDGKEFFGSLKTELQKIIYNSSNGNDYDASRFYINRQIEYLEVFNDILIDMYIDNDKRADLSCKGHTKTTQQIESKRDTNVKTIIRENNYDNDKKFINIFVKNPSHKTQDTDKRSDVEIIIQDDKFVNELFGKFQRQQFMLLSAEPGMGKSTLLEFISFTYQQTSSDSVYFFNLNTFHSQLLQVKDTDELSQLLTVFRTAISDKNLKTLQKTSKGSGNNIKHFMFFDAFDEVLPKNRPKVVKLFKLILQSTNVKILVSTRKTLKDLLEKEFGVKAMSLVPFDRQDQESFLRKFWKVCEEHDNSFRKYVTHLFQFFHSDINRALCEFTGIPLMLKMLAEVYADHFNKYLSTEHNDGEKSMPQNMNSIINLYEQFVGKCFANKMNKQFVNWSSDLYEEHEGPLFETFTVEHLLLAIKHLQIKALQSILDNEKNIKTLHEFETRITNGTEKSSLVESVGGDTKFIHRSYAEFLVAKYLFRNIEFYENSIFGPDKGPKFFEEHHMIRIFFFALIEERHEIERLEIVERQYKVNSNIALWACEAHGQKTVDFLLRTTYDTNIINRLLGKAAQHNCYNICAYLLGKHKVKIDFKTDEMTPLYIAAMQGHDGVVKLLIENRASINITKSNGWTPLHISVQNGHSEVVKMLIEHGGDVNAKESKNLTALHCGSINGHSEVVKMLIDHRGDINAKNNDGITPLYVSAHNGHSEVVKMLIEYGGDVNAKNNDGITPLYVSAHNGHSEVVKMLIEYGGDVNAKNNDGFTPLFVSTHNGHSEVVKMLIDHGGDVNAKNSNGFTPLLISANNGHLEVVKMLIEHGGDVNAKEIDSWTPLHFGAKYGHSEVVKMLIAHGGDVTAKESKNWTALHLGAKNGHSEVVKMLIEHGGDVNAKEVDSWTALHFVAQNGHSEVVKVLIDHGGDVNAKNSNGFTPLLISAHNGHSDVVKMLIDHGGDVNAKNSNGFTPLLISAQNGHSEVVKMLIDHGGDVNAKEIDSWTPLHFGAEYGHSEVVKMLIDHGGDVNAKEIDSWTPLHCGAKNGHSEVVKLLIDHGGDVNAKEVDSWTPLHISAQNGHSEVVKVLIDHGGDVNAKNKNGFTSLFISAQNGHTEVVKVLIDHGGDVNAKTNNGFTPLYISAQNGHSEVVKVLMEHGGDVNAKEIDYWTPLHISAQNGHTEVVKVLIDHGGDVNSKINNGSTPLYIAAQNGHILISRILIDHGGDVNAAENNNWTALHVSAQNGHSEVVKVLIDHGWDVNAKTNKGSTPLYIAAQNGHIKVVRSLIDHGGDVGTKNLNDHTPLHIATENGRLEVVKLLINHCENVNAKNNKGLTPHDLAVQNNHLEVAKILTHTSENINAS